MSAFPVVGIGASAGGLAAFEAFFSGMPSGDVGMAFLVVQHLAPHHDSLLSDLVQHYTAMRVRDAVDGMAVEADCAYVIPPNRDMALIDGTLRLFEPTARRGVRLPIDFLFRSLAEALRERAIGVVLSGTGRDGTLGLRVIKGRGGLAMVQEPGSTEYDGMPRSAIDGALVDYVLRPEDMPAQLVSYSARRFAVRADGRLNALQGEPPEGLDTLMTAASDALDGVFKLIARQTGHDFSQYKRNSMSRRVARRIALHQLRDIDAYLRFARQEPAEVEALFHDLLIGVTSFFRDPEAFAVVEDEVVRRLLSRQPDGEALRVWVTACSTGEEAYAIAILLQEEIERCGMWRSFTIFATDIDARAIARARAGVFPSSIAQDVSAERLERFFVEDEGAHTYRVTKQIRDKLVFSAQDVTRDPPFSRIDLICCRNLLIYLKPEVQTKVLGLFHYALNPGAFLFLGSSESVGELGTHFHPIDRTWKIYERDEDGQASRRPAPNLSMVVRAETTARILGPAHAPRGDPDGLRTLTEQAMLGHYTGVGVLVDAQGEILHIVGRTGDFLEAAPGTARLNILVMARQGLRRALTLGVHRAAKEGVPVRYPGLRVTIQGRRTDVDLTVLPVRHGGGTHGAKGAAELLVVILEIREPGSVEREGAENPHHVDPDARIAALEQELRANDEYLQATLEEFETSNDELRSLSTELQSVNEELQSANEELETSKEELQSLNEELATVNAELQAKVAHLSRANNDLNNLLASTGIGTLLVDHDLRIARYTPATTQIVNLIDSDVGRPVGHLVSNLVGYDRLVEDLTRVLDTLVPMEHEVQTRAGTWHLMRMRPYRTLQNVIEGVVITFADITPHKIVESTLAEARVLTEGILASVRDAVVILDDAERVVVANGAFCAMVGLPPEGVEGRSVFEMGSTVPDLRALLTRLRDADADADADADTEEVLEIIPVRGEGHARYVVVASARRVWIEARGGALTVVALREERP